MAAMSIIQPNLLILHFFRPAGFAAVWPELPEVASVTRKRVCWLAETVKAREDDTGNVSANPVVPGVPDLQ